MRKHIEIFYPSDAATVIFDVATYIDFSDVI
jgi:hypothetical protein